MNVTLHKFGPYNLETVERQRIYESSVESFCLLEQYVHQYGKPHREEWLNLQAYQDAVAIYDAAQTLIKTVRGACPNCGKTDMQLSIFRPRATGLGDSIKLVHCNYCGCEREPT